MACAALTFSFTFRVLKNSILHSSFLKAQKAPVYHIKTVSLLYYKKGFVKIGRVQKSVREGWLFFVRIAKLFFV